MIKPEGARVKPIKNTDFGRTAEDYLTHRAGFPKSLFEKLKCEGIGLKNQLITDLGTGTGSLALGFASTGSQVTAIDPSASMLDAARGIAQQADLAVKFQVASAEQTQLPAQSMDIVPAGQCWHWFDRPTACREIARILKPNRNHRLLRLATLTGKFS
jgi:ubiquinone/menaquinone biosynthesis C-methylase UbiE